MGPFRHIAYEVADARARITLARPEKLNAISPLMEQRARGGVVGGRRRRRRPLDHHPGRRPLVLLGVRPDAAAPRGCPSATRRATASAPRSTTTPGWSSARTLACSPPSTSTSRSSPRSTGTASRAAPVIALFCDFVICADDAVFGFPAARDLGALPANVWLYHVGPQWAKRLTMTGDSISGADAAHLGLALKSVPLDRPGGRGRGPGRPLRPHRPPPAVGQQAHREPGPRADGRPHAAAPGGRERRPRPPRRRGPPSTGAASASSACARR